MNWINIKDKQPPENIPVLFETPKGWDGEGYHVGYWSDYKNCMLESNDGSDCKQWGVSRWCYIEEVYE